jgi:hypothetical protein
MSNIIHDNLRDIEIVLLEDLENEKGKINYKDYLNQQHGRFGELALIHAREAASYLHRKKYIEYKGDNVHVTNRGWAVIEGAKILSTLKTMLKDGEITPDYFDKDIPCFAYRIAYSRPLVDIPLIQKAAKKHKGNAQNPVVRSDEPFETVWFIIYE